MRYIIYGSAILAALLIATIASGHLPKGLPLRELPDEVYR
jgi:hypothetical protein